MAKGDIVKFFVFAIDGLNLALLKRFIREGAMPYMESLLSAGVHGPMQSTDPPLTPTAWASIFSGLNPERHGIHDFIQRRADGSFRPVNAASISGKLIWDIIGQQGKKSIVCNPPVTYPPYPINGILLSDHLFTPANADVKSYPPSIIKELETALGSYKMFSEVTYDPRRIRQLLDDYRQDVTFKTKMFHHLSANHEWDLFILYFWATDHLQHSLSHLLDESHPLFNRELHKQHYPAILDFVRHLDASIREICESLPKDTPMLIVSDHGFCNVWRYIYINTWLLQNGYIHLKKRPSSRIKRLLFDIGLTPENAYKFVNYFSSLVTRPPTDNSQLHFLASFFLSSNDFDWDNTLAFSKGNYGQIFFNRARKNPITDGELSAKLKTDLLSWRDPKDNAPIVHRVLLQNDFAKAPNSALPDMMVYSNENGYKPLGTLDFNSNKSVGDIFGITGHHDKNAFFLAMGPDVKTGLTVDNVRTVDITPTILSMMGVSIPGGLDGRSLDECFTKSGSAQKNQATPIATPEARGPEYEYTEKEQQEISDRLKNLGYM